MSQRPPSLVVQAAEGAEMDDSFVLSMRSSDVLLVGAFRLEVIHTQRGRATIRIEAPDEPVVMLRNGKPKVGKHHLVVEKG